MKSLDSREIADAIQQAHGRRPGGSSIEHGYMVRQWPVPTLLGLIASMIVLGGVLGTARVWLLHQLGITDSWWVTLLTTTILVGVSYALLLGTQGLVGLYSDGSVIRTSARPKNRQATVSHAADIEVERDPPRWRTASLSIDGQRVHLGFNQDTDPLIAWITDHQTARRSSADA